MFARTLTIASVALLGLGSVAAKAAIIDFNDNPNGVYWVPQVVSDGFTATEVNNEGGPPLGTNIAVDGSGISNGTVHLDSWTNNSSDSVWTLTQQGGGAFSLLSFDFGNGYPGGDATVSQLTLTGLTADNNTVTQIFDISQQDFQTLAVSSDFSDVVSVTFDAFGEGNRAAYDNIVVGDAVPTPEPATFTLLVAGVAGLRLIRRKRV